MTGLSNIRMKNEEAHIDTVRDDIDIENGDVDDDEDEDEDEVVEIKTPSRRSSSSSLNGFSRRRPQAEHGDTHLRRVRPGATRAEASRATYRMMRPKASRLNLARARARARAQRRLADHATRDHRGSALQSAQHAC